MPGWPVGPVARGLSVDVWGSRPRALAALARAAAWPPKPSGSGLERPWERRRETGEEAALSFAAKGSKGKRCCLTGK